MGVVRKVAQAVCRAPGGFCWLPTTVPRFKVTWGKSDKLSITDCRKQLNDRLRGINVPQPRIPLPPQSPNFPRVTFYSARRPLSEMAAPRLPPRGSALPLDSSEGGCPARFALGLTVLMQAFVSGSEATRYKSPKSLFGRRMGYRKYNYFFSHTLDRNSSASRNRKKTVQSGVKEFRSSLTIKLASFRAFSLSLTIMLSSLEGKKPYSRSLSSSRQSLARLKRGGTLQSSNSQLPTPSRKNVCV